MALRDYDAAVIAHPQSRRAVFVEGHRLTALQHDRVPVADLRFAEIEASPPSANGLKRRERFGLGLSRRVAMGVNATPTGRDAVAFEEKSIVRLRHKGTLPRRWQMLRVVAGVGGAPRVRPPTGRHDIRGQDMAAIVAGRRPSLGTTCMPTAQVCSPRAPAQPRSGPW